MQTLSLESMNRMAPIWQLVSLNTDCYPVLQNVQTLPWLTAYQQQPSFASLCLFQQYLLTGSLLL